MEKNVAFISYRREDEGPAARFIKGELERVFMSSQIFMDTDNIRITENWTKVIEENLEKSKILIVIIGKNWLKIQDEFFRRRIDNEDDWVRREIDYALKNKIPVVPFLIGASLPHVDALPTELKSLLEYEVLSLSANNWRNDLAKLINALKNEGFHSMYEEIKMPTPIKNMLFPLALTNSQINDDLKGFTGWKIVDYFSKEKVPKSGEAIEKVFKFLTFEKAIEFMYLVSKHISNINHHPEWENIWVSVRVRLSTWDIGHKVSNLDIELAKHIEETFLEF